MSVAAPNLDALIRDIRACRICRDTPTGLPLQHDPRPVLRPSKTAKICICSQAPGVRVHASGTPFTDASGDRLRSWLQLTPEQFYDHSRIAIVPMGFCFPGHDAVGGDLPPRRECAATWHKRLFERMPQIELILAIGSHAQRWHLNGAARDGMTALVRRWREQLNSPTRPRCVALPHPSWRNNAWLRNNPWFEGETLPRLRDVMRAFL